MKIKSITIHNTNNIIWTFDDNSNIISEILDSKNNKISNFKIINNVLHINDEPVKFDAITNSEFPVPGQTLFASAVYNPKVSIDFIFMAYLGNDEISSISRESNSKIKITLKNNVVITGDASNPFNITKNSSNNYLINNNELNGNSLYWESLPNINNSTIITDNNLLQINYGNFTINIDSDIYNKHHHGHHHGHHHKPKEISWKYILLVVIILIIKIALILILTFVVHKIINLRYFTYLTAFFSFCILFLF